MLFYTISKIHFLFLVFHILQQNFAIFEDQNLIFNLFQLQIKALNFIFLVDFIILHFASIIQIDINHFLTSFELIFH